MKYLIVIIALLTTGCAVLQDRKAAVAYAGAAADFASTKIKLDEACRETNPLLGQPSDATLAAVQVGTLFGTSAGVCSV